MDDKVTKSSFLLKKSMLPDIILFLESYNYIKTPIQNFQIFSVKIKNSHLIIYKSGIVVYEESKDLVKILEKYFTSIHFPIPQELEMTSQQLVKQIIDPSEKPLEDKTSSYWFSTGQIGHLIQLYEKREYKILREIKNLNYRICKTDRNCLDISKNGLLKSNSISDYQEDLDFVIDNYQIDKGNDFFIAIESWGKYSQLGPVILSAVGITGQQSTRLQKQGVRHMKIGRNNDPNRYFQHLEENVTFQKYIIIQPEEINQENYDISKLNKFTQFFTELNKEIPNGISSMIIYDKSIEEDIQQFSFPKNVTIEKLYNSMSTAAASVIAKYHFDNWLVKKSQYYQILINKSNLNKILEFPYKEKLVKLKYLSRKR